MAVPQARSMALGRTPAKQTSALQARCARSGILNCEASGVLLPRRIGCLLGCTSATPKRNNAINHRHSFARRRVALRSTRRGWGEHAPETAMYPKEGSNTPASKRTGAIADPTELRRREGLAASPRPRGPWPNRWRSRHHDRKEWQVSLECSPSNELRRRPHHSGPGHSFRWNGYARTTIRIAGPAQKVPAKRNDFVVSPTSWGSVRSEHNDIT